MAVDEPGFEKGPGVENVQARGKTPGRLLPQTEQERPPVTLEA